MRNSLFKVILNALPSTDPVLVLGVLLHLLRDRHVCDHECVAQSC
jgi:hypothetical protein